MDEGKEKKVRTINLYQKSCLEHSQSQRVNKNGRTLRKQEREKKEWTNKETFHWLPFALNGHASL